MSFKFLTWAKFDKTKSTHDGQTSSENSTCQLKSPFDRFSSCHPNPFEYHSQQNEQVATVMSNDNRFILLDLKLFRSPIRTQNQSSRSSLSKQYAQPVVCWARVGESLMFLAVVWLRILFKFELQKNKTVVVWHDCCYLFVLLAVVLEGVCVTTGEPIEWRFELTYAVYWAGLAIMCTFSLVEFGSSEKLEIYLLPPLGKTSLRVCSAFDWCFSNQSTTPQQSDCQYGEY